MHVSLWNVALQTVNFLALVWLLQRLLFKPVRAAIARRQEAINASLREAEGKKVEADATIAEYRRKIAEARAEAGRVRDQAVAAAELDIHRLRQEATGRARAEADRARADMDRQRAEALRALEVQAAELATAMAERLLREAVPESDGPFLWKTIAGIEAMDVADRAALAQRFASGPLQTVSSRALDAASRQRFEAWLASFAGRPVVASYSVDPSLIAGIELRLPTCVWRSHWREGLDRMKAEVHGHEVAA